MIVVMEPAVKQIVVHPYVTQDDLRAFSTSHGLITEASSPIAQGGVLNDPTIMEIAERRRCHHRPLQHHLPQVDRRDAIVAPVLLRRLCSPPAPGTRR